MAPSGFKPQNGMQLLHRAQGGKDLQMKTVIDTNPILTGEHYCFGVCPKFPNSSDYADRYYTNCRYCAQDRRVRGYK